MPMHDLLVRSATGFRPGAFVLAIFLTAAAYGVALLSSPRAMTVDVWVPMVMAALLAAASHALVERALERGAGHATGTILALVGGSMLTVLVALMLSSRIAPGNQLSVLSAGLPIDLRTEAYGDLARAPEVYGAYLIAGGLVVLGALGFGSGGGLFFVYLLAITLAAQAADSGRVRGASAAAWVAAGRSVAVAASYLAPGLVGLACLVGGTRGATAGLVARKPGDVRGAGLAILVGLILLLVAGSVELFGGGSLSKMLDGN